MNSELSTCDSHCCDSCPLAGKYCFQETILLQRMQCSLVYHLKSMAPLEDFARANGLEDKDNPAVDKLCPENLTMVLKVLLWYR